MKKKELCGEQECREQKCRRKRTENKYAGKSIKSLSGIKHAQKKFLEIKQKRTSACIKQKFNKIQYSIMQE
jgi:hypothetical protein